MGMPDIPEMPPLPEPPPLPMPPKMEETEEKRRKTYLQELIDLRRKGRPSTVLTGGIGLTTPAPLFKHTLLGE